MGTRTVLGVGGNGVGGERAGREKSNPCRGISEMNQRPGMGQAPGRIWE